MPRNKTPVDASNRWIVTLSHVTVGCHLTAGGHPELQSERCKPTSPNIK